MTNRFTDYIEELDPVLDAMWQKSGLAVLDFADALRSAVTGWANERFERLGDVIAKEDSDE